MDENTLATVTVRLLANFIIPCTIAIVVGVKKNRTEFGVLMGLLFGVLGFFLPLGLILGWIAPIAVCCLKKRIGNK